MRSISIGVLAGLLATTFLSAAVFADPPGRVGRLNYMSGSVSFRPGDVDDWSPAVINIPLKTGDHLWTDFNSEAEIHVGSTAIRLAPETAFEFLNLEDRALQIRLTQGSVNIRVRQLADSDLMELDTPNSSVSLLRTGLYRINVDPDGNTTVVDRAGESEITAMGSAFTLHPRESAIINGIDAPTYDIQTAYPNDPWDDWCAERDRREDQAVSVRYVPREMVGYEDLDVYGTWQTYPEYGPVWVPSEVPVGWAPYRYGHWIWVEPWGWTWVDDMAWGFAPFHYGRWASAGGVWVWVPGRIVARPVYAPALVAFVGGNNLRVSVGIGSGVGWFPLGPHEVYVPAYHVSPTYVQNVNITHVNVTNINVTNVNVVNQTYVNRNVPGAVTAVPQDTFTHARPVSRSALNIPQQALVSAPITGTAPPVAPQAESVTGRAANAPAAPHPPAQVLSKPVVARTPPPPAPVPFAARQSALAANPGKPVDPITEASLRERAAAAPALVRPAVSNNPSEPSAGGLRPARQGVTMPHPATAAPPNAAAPRSNPAVNDRPPRVAPQAAPTATPNNSANPAPIPRAEDRPNRQVQAPAPATPPAEKAPPQGNRQEKGRGRPNPEKKEEEKEKKPPRGGH